MVELRGAREIRAKIRGVPFVWSPEPLIDGEDAWRLVGEPPNTDNAMATWRASELAEGLTVLLHEGLLAPGDLPAACRALGWLRLDSTRFNRNFKNWGSVAVLMAQRGKWGHLFSMVSEYDRSALHDLSPQQVHGLIICGIDDPCLSRSPTAAEPGFVPSTVLIDLVEHAATYMRNSRALAEAITCLPDWLIFRACRKRPELAIEDWLDWDMDCANVPSYWRHGTRGTAAGQPAARSAWGGETWERRGGDASAVCFNDKTAAAVAEFDSLLAGIADCREKARPKDER